jgi:AcrR family transcriptional regulator
VKARERLSAAERRRAILESVTAAFAQNGFNGTTTRALASAAGISEALIYKHFRSKQALYAAMLQVCVRGPAFAEFNRILALEPSTSTLVRMVHFMVAHHARSDGADAATALLSSFMARSMLEDGDFARLTHRIFAGAWIAKFQLCLAKAVKAGDLAAMPARPDLQVWFIHHLAFSLMLHLRPKVPVVDYRLSRDRLIDDAVWFALKGVGFEAAVIERHYRPAAYRGRRPRQRRSTPPLRRVQRPAADQD